ncbi:MAG: hypothetical protein QOJ65_44 [Fimbriimonadaceae bacterium]|jgi:hypothetical protein|nr:hypothetical protein [Fimbriimonadaceae bacterium]
MKSVVSLLLAAVAGLAVAQVPDVQVKADLGPTYRNEVLGGSDVHWYDPFGRHSYIALQFALEPGFRAYVSQKIERIRNDGDKSPIDESFVEDVGVWRAGKQYLPFGQQRVLRDSVVAVRSDTELFLREFPVSIAACDGGSGHQRGIVGRIGRTFGLSFAIGQHFGIAGTSMTQARLPEESPGVKGGYRHVFGADATREVGVFVLRGEYVLFRQGHEGAHDREIIDLTATLQPALSRSLTFGYSQATHPGIQSFRVQGAFLVATNVWAEPWVRTRNGKMFDTGVSLRVRL